MDFLKNDIDIVKYNYGIKDIFNILFMNIKYYQWIDTARYEYSATAHRTRDSTPTL